MALLILGGCATGSSGGGVNNGGGTTTGQRVYVIQEPVTFSSGPASILEFSESFNGSVSPAATIVDTVNPSVFNDLSSDGSGNIYVAALYATPSASDTFRAYVPGTTGVSASLRSVTAAAAAPSIGATEAMVAGPTGEIYVAGQFGGVQVYSATAAGASTPTRTIYGYLMGGATLSTLLEPYALAADAADNIYVLNRVGVSGGATVTSPIVVFGPTANGNVTPTRLIGGPLTTLASPGGITVDSAGNIWVTNNGTTGSSILEFAPGASGNVAPILTIAGSLTTLGTLHGIKLDVSGSVLVVSGGYPTPSVIRFAARASGNVAPILTITSPAWTHPDASETLAVY